MKEQGEVSAADEKANLKDEVVNKQIDLELKHTGSSIPSVENQGNDPQPALRGSREGGLKGWCWQVALCWGTGEDTLKNILPSSRETRFCCSPSVNWGLKAVRLGWGLSGHRKSSTREIILPKKLSHPEITTHQSF